MREPTSYLPTIELRDFILSYGILDIPDGVEEPYFSPPLGLSGFIIHIINARNCIVAKIADRDHYTHETVATGQVTRPVHGRIVGRTRILMVFFHPLGMHQLFGNDMALLTNGSRSLHEFLGAGEATDFVMRLRENQEDLPQVRVLNEFFAARVPLVNERTTQMRETLEYIHARKGDIAIAELEREFRYEKKTLERRFKKMLGLSPKVYSEIYRFRCLINLIQSQPGISWAQLADQAGFYDQSHMSRYIKDYLNVSPASIVQLDMDFINYLLTR